MTDSYVTVIGAVNVDICGTSKEELVLYDSNPGVSHTSYGGVGRNIADNLCRLGERVEMITALGDDHYAKGLIEASEKVGISFKHSLFVKGAQTSTYISINNSDGDMSLAVNDMSIYDNLTIDFIREKLDIINGSRLLIIDANISEELIEYITSNCRVPIMADPVSTKKAVRFREVLGSLYMIKPNIFETELLSGIKIDSDEDVARAAKYFLGKGMKAVFISMGSEGAYYSDGKVSGYCPCAKGRIVNTNGCGDAFVAAVAWTFMNGGTVTDMARAGVAASAVCAESEDAISPFMSSESVKKRMD